LIYKVKFITLLTAKGSNVVNPPSREETNLNLNNLIIKG
jgi:hypothetical protein